MAELSELRKQLSSVTQAMADTERKARKMHEAFAMKAGEFREAVRSLFGFYVDMESEYVKGLKGEPVKVKKYVVRRGMERDPNNSLVFKDVSRDGPGAPKPLGSVLVPLNSPYLIRLPDDVRQILMDAGLVDHAGNSTGQVDTYDTIAKFLSAVLECAHG